MERESVCVCESSSSGGAPGTRDAGDLEGWKGQGATDRIAPELRYRRADQTFGG